MGWGDQPTLNAIQQATLELEKKVLRYCCKGIRFVRGSDLVEKPDAIEGGSIAYLVRKGFVTAPKCNLTHGMNSTEDPDDFCLIDGKVIEEVLLEIEDYSEVAKKAFEQHGLVPGDVVIDILKGCTGSDNVEHFLSVFRHYGVFILPTEIKCEHHLAPVGASPRDNFRLPISLPEPADRAYMIPHLLSRKKLPSELQSSYLRTEAFAIRHKGGLRISEGLFYFLVAIFIKHYPNAPRCYYRAARLRVERGHILELKLQDDVILACMLVQTSDKSFQVTGTARVCSKVRTILMDDAEKLNCSYLAKQLQFGAIMKTHDYQQDFVDLESQGFPSRKSVYSEEGEDFVPHRSMYLWYNRYGPEGTMLEKNFAKLSEEMPAEDVLRYLIDKGKISGEQYREVEKDDGFSRQSSRLLMMLGKRNLECDSLLYDALCHLKLYSLAELMKKRRAEATENAEIDISEEDQHHKKTVVAQPVQDNEDPVNVSVPSTSHTENTKRIAKMTEGSTEEATSRLNISRSALPTQAPSALPFTPPAAPSDLHTRSQNERGGGEHPVQSLFEAKYWHVERASDYFNERPFREGGKRLGSGSFGTVYHGVLHSENGQKYEVAIKRLKNSHSLNPAQVELNRKQFGIEIHMLTCYVNKNIIALVGFSTDGPELCLIFEYMANGALSHRLDCRNSTPPLQWKTRLTISYDIACGLDFLHTEYRLPVIHRDVKSSNVLLTSNFTAKLSDFGLAVIGAEAEESVTSTAVGTRPYMPPEAFQKIVTTKLDVYGFGVIMYELGTGLPPYSSKKKQDLKSYVDDIEGQGIDLTKMLDPKAKWPKAKGLGKGGNDGLTLLEVAKRCTVKEYTKRVSIRDVLPTLQQLANISN